MKLSVACTGTGLIEFYANGAGWNTLTSVDADESWGIDNLVITQDIPDPVPFSPVAWVVLLIGLGVLGVAGIRSHHKAV